MSSRRHPGKQFSSTRGESHLYDLGTPLSVNIDINLPDMEESYGDERLINQSNQVLRIRISLILDFQILFND